MSKNLDPVTGKIYPVFFYYSVPSVIGMLAMSSAVIVDGFFLGNYAGISSLAAANLTIPVSALFFGLALMLSIGGAIRCGKYLGAGNTKAANAIFSQTFVLIIVLSIVLSALGLIFMEQLVFLLGADKMLAPAVAEYLTIVLVFNIFHLGSICLSYFIRIANLPFWAAASLIVGSLTNVFLDWLFVVHLQMKHEGAALATGLAAMLIFIFLCIPFLAQRTTLKFYWRKKDIPEVFQAALSGFPEFIDEFSVGIIVVVFNWIIMKKLGENGIAAFSIINYMILTGLVISYGISDSLHSVVSRNFGALKHKRINKVMILSTVLVFIVGLAISVLLVTIPDTVAELFIDSKEMETIKLTNYFISRIWPIFIVNGINIVLVSYLTAMNRSLDSTLIILTRNLLLPVIFLFIIHVLIGKDAILIVLPLSEIATFCLAIFLMYKNSPKKLITNMALLNIAV
jgi:Na+-driven multidrug efflux pump